MDNILFSELILKTSWVTALLCFLVSASYFYLYRNGWNRKSSIISFVVFAYWGFCYIGTQFGTEWFLANQRAFFRLASTAAQLTTLYFIHETYNFIKPIIEAGSNGKHNLFNNS